MADPYDKELGALVAAAVGQEGILHGGVKLHRSGTVVCIGTFFFPFFFFFFFFFFSRYQTKVLEETINVAFQKTPQSPPFDFRRTQT